MIPFWATYMHFLQCPFTYFSKPDTKGGYINFLNFFLDLLAARPLRSFVCLTDLLIIQSNGNFPAERWAVPMIWSENWVWEASGQRSRKRNKETSSDQVTKRKCKGNETGWYNPVFMSWISAKLSQLKCSYM